MTTYRIRRFCADDSAPDHRLVIEAGLTLEEAQTHCRDPETSSRRTITNRHITQRNGCDWFDGYEEEKS